MPLNHIPDRAPWKHLAVLALALALLQLAPAPATADDVGSTSTEPVPPYKWAFTTPLRSIFTAVDTTDVDGDGLDDVVTTAWGSGRVPHHGGVYALHGLTGLPLWYTELLHPVIWRMQVVDLDGNGEDEVVLAALGGPPPPTSPLTCSGRHGQAIVQVLEARTGHVLGSYTSPQFDRSIPHGLTFGDLDGDGVQDVVFTASALFFDGLTGVAAVSGSHLLTEGSAGDEALLWTLETDTPPFGKRAAAVVGDKVFIGAGSHLYVVNGSDGTVIWRPNGYDGKPEIRADSVRAVDYDGDGDLEVAVVNVRRMQVLDPDTHERIAIFHAPKITEGASRFGPESLLVDFTGDGVLDPVLDGRGKDAMMFMWGVDGATSNLTWEVPLGTSTGFWDAWDMIAVDMDGDGAEEVVLIRGTRPYVEPLDFHAENRPRVLVIDPVKGVIEWEQGLRARPESLAVADLDGTGNLEIVAGSSDRMLYAFAPSLDDDRTSSDWQGESGELPRSICFDETH